MASPTMSMPSSPPSLTRVLAAPVGVALGEALDPEDLAGGPRTPPWTLAGAVLPPALLAANLYAARVLPEDLYGVGSVAVKSRDEESHTEG
jgi:hypothetical protein